jgi:hypothetical protein
MRNTLPMRRGGFGDQMSQYFGTRSARHLVIGVILLTALLAFELFNFDTTRYALESLLGDINFLGITWATILAIAFCAIDFAGLARLFTPERGREEPKEVWYLMGAWLLGATMNAVMTWWAVSLTLLNHTLGNEIMSREQLLLIVPVFVAVLVWLTRILFIGSLTVAGEHLFSPEQVNANTAVPKANVPAAQPKPKPGGNGNGGGSNRPTMPAPSPTTRPVPAASFSPPPISQPVREPVPAAPQRASRIRREAPSAPAMSAPSMSAPMSNPTPPAPMPVSPKGPASRPNMPIGMKARPYNNQ